MKLRIAVLCFFLALLSSGKGGGNAPFPADRLSVLVIEETDPRSPRVAAALNSSDWMDVVDGKSGVYRVVDQDIPVDTLPEPWKSARRRGFKSLPWVVISNGRSGFEGELPLGEGGLADLVRNY